MQRLYLFLSVLLVSWTGHSMAGDFSKSNGPLSDTAFYYSVFCKAQTKAKCQSDIPRWTKYKRRKLKVAIVGIQPGFSNAKAQQIERAITRAITELNSIGADFKLFKAPKSKARRADIQIILLNTNKGQQAKNAGLAFQNRVVQRAMAIPVVLRSTILQSHIAVSKNIRTEFINRVILEEITQSLGPRWDVLNPYYQTRSIFSQISDPKVDRLSAQDRRVIKIHYPK